MLNEAEAGVQVAELCRREGISDVTYYRWKAKYGGLEVNEARWLRELEEENGRLKKIVAQQALDIDALKVVLSSFPKQSAFPKRCFRMGILARLFTEGQRPVLISL